MTHIEAWLKFSKIHPARWKHYDGYCECDLCQEYRIMFKRWFESVHPAPGERESTDPAPSPGGGK